MDAPPVELPGYEVDALLGRGTIGSVFRASPVAGGGDPVAVKWVPMAGDAGVSARVRRDAEILNALDHPHILRILDVIEHHGGLALVTAYAGYGSLADVIARQGRVSWPRVTTMAMGVADALEAAHRAGVLHGDLKPSNVLLAAGERPLVADC